MNYHLPAFICVLQSWKFKLPYHCNKQDVWGDRKMYFQLQLEVYSKLGLLTCSLITQGWTYNYTLSVLHHDHIYTSSVPHNAKIGKDFSWLTYTYTYPLIQFAIVTTDVRGSFSRMCSGNTTPHTKYTHVTTCLMYARYHMLTCNIRTQPHV